MDRLALSDLADRVSVDALSTVLGVATVLFGGERRYAMRIWLDLSPREDRGVVLIPVEGPEGDSLDYMLEIMDRIEAILLPFIRSQEPAEHIISLVAPRGAGQGPVNSGFVILRLEDWKGRKVSQFEVRRDLLQPLAGITGAQVFAINPPSLGGAAFSQPVQMVIAAADVEQAHVWAQEVLARARQIPGLSPKHASTTSPPTRSCVSRWTGSGRRQSAFA